MTVRTYRTHGPAEEILRHLYALELSRREVGIWVEHLISDANLKVQMRTRSPSGGSNEGYLFSFFHLLARTDQNSASMSIMREHISTVIDKNRLPVTAVAFAAACGNYSAVRTCQNRIALARSYVQTGMKDPSAKAEA